ncbi:glycosyltransferase family 2 protein [Paenibacillus sp. M1]|uniref:Glycosyltransferase family 2 protein n=1 Tax=Paenibacillus haidiansis TaxID=1574488 RepID=A0ABU7VWK8_9BACL
MVKLSIIIPTYNCMNRNYNNDLCLNNSLKSLSDQTMCKEEYELIFVDDCSSDDTASFIEKNNYIKKNKVTIIKCKNNSGGASVPRNIGMENASGEFIFFMDSDDYLSKNALENMYNFAKHTNSDIIVPKFLGVGRTAAKKIFEKGNITNANIINDDLLSTMTSFRLYKREFLLKNNIKFPDDFKQYEDFYFNINAYTKNPKVAILADDIYYYWVRTDGENLSQINLDFSSFLYYHAKILDLLKNENSFLIKIRYVIRILQLWRIKQIYKEYEKLEEDINANYDHKLFKEFVINNIGQEVIQYLPRKESLLLMYVTKYDRYRVMELSKAINFHEEKQYYIYSKNVVSNSFEDELMSNYWLRKMYGVLNLELIDLIVRNSMINIKFNIYSSIGRNFDKYRLILKSRSADDSLIINSSEPSFCFNINDLFTFTKGYWDVFVEVELNNNLVLGSAVPMNEEKIKNHDKNQIFQFYRNWIGGLTLIYNNN